MAVEIYEPRKLSDLGQWTYGALALKVYGLGVQDITPAMIAQARVFVQSEVLDQIGEDTNDAGFVIVHPGTLGLTISVHWWVQGSVLCQRIQRQLYDAEAPVGERPVIGCVWELAVVNAEQQAWRRFMMKAPPDRAAYLAARVTEAQV